MGNTTKAREWESKKKRRGRWTGTPTSAAGAGGGGVGRQLNTEQTTKCRHVGKWKMNATERVGCMERGRSRRTRGRGNYNAARHVNSCQLPAHDTRQHNWLWSHYAGILMGRGALKASERERDRKPERKSAWAVSEKAEGRGCGQEERAERERTEIAFTRRAQFMALLWLI